MEDEATSEDDKKKRRAERKAARAAKKASVQDAGERTGKEEARQQRRAERKAINEQPAISNSDEEAKKQARRARRAERKKAKNAGKENKHAQRERRRDSAGDESEHNETGVKSEKKISRRDRRKSRKAGKAAERNASEDATERKRRAKAERGKKGKKRAAHKTGAKGKRKRAKQRKEIDTGEMPSFPLQRGSTEIVASFTAFDAVALAGLQRQRFVVDVNGVAFHAYFERSDRNRLFVLLSGEAPAGRNSGAHFERRAWGEMLPGSVLWISDPALDLSDDMSLGWYVGTREKDYSAEMASLVERVAADLGLTPSDVVFYAGSGGGFAALMCARHLPGASCIVINPQIELASHDDEEHLEKLARFFSGEPDFELMASEHPERVSVLAAFPSADSLPPTVYVQNRQDKHHFDEHYALFCRTYSVPPDGGLSANGRVLSLPFEYGAGHVPEPRPMVRPLLEQALAFFDRFRQRPK